MKLRAICLVLLVSSTLCQFDFPSFGDEQQQNQSNGSTNETTETDDFEYITKLIKDSETEINKRKTRMNEKFKPAKNELDFYETIQKAEELQRINKEILDKKDLSRRQEVDQNDKLILELITKADRLEGKVDRIYRLRNSSYKGWDEVK